MGANTYPRASTFENEDGDVVTEVVRDEFQIDSFSINYELRVRIADIVVSVGVDQQIRDSNFPLFDRDRTILLVGVRTAF